MKHFVLGSIWGALGAASSVLVVTYGFTAESFSDGDAIAFAALAAIFAAVVGGLVGGVIAVLLGAMQLDSAAPLAAGFVLPVPWALLLEVGGEHSDAPPLKALILVGLSAYGGWIGWRYLKQLRKELLRAEGEQAQAMVRVSAARAVT